MRKRALLVTALAALAATAFANPLLSQRSDTVVRMSGAPVNPRVVRLIPEVTIGGLDVPPAYQFRAIQNFTVARDGAVWVVHGSLLSSEVDIFDSDGKHARRLARQGSGPGEYRRPRRVAQLPDGRMVLRDLLHINRFNVYTPAGSYDTTWTFTRGFAGPVNFDADTAGVVWVGYSHSMNDMEFKVARMLNGVLIDTLLMPTASRVSFEEMRQGAGRVGAPFQPGWRYAWSPFGYYATAWTANYAVDLRIPVLLPGSRFGVWREGDVVRSIRRRVEPVPVSNEERNDRRARLAETRDASQGRLTGSIPDIPRTKPPIAGLQFGDDGRLWVRVATPSERFTPERVQSADGQPVVQPLAWREPVVFDVFEPDGRYIGRVGAPAYPVCSSGSMRVRGEVVWCSGRDDDDIPVLRRYRIEWR
jgi:hypothetical protein